MAEQVVAALILMLMLLIQSHPQDMSPVLLNHMMYTTANGRIFLNGSGSQKAERELPKNPKGSSVTQEPSTQEGSWLPASWCD